MSDVFVPFMACLKVVPNRNNGKRFEIWRNRETMARHVHNQLVNVTDLTIARPGGSVSYPGASNGDWAMSNLAYGVAAKPQFGQSPDMLTVIGFYKTSSTTYQAPYGDKTLFDVNTVKTGPNTGAPGWRNDLGPTSYCRTLMRAIKTLIESSITLVTITIIKMEVNGVKFGQGGHHF